MQVSRTSRRLAAAGLVLALAVLAPATASAAPAFAADGDAAIGPGVRIETPLPDGAELCTANFVFAAAGRVLLGTAAHCTAGPDASPSVDGCVEPVMGDGTAVTVRGRDGRAYRGTVAYNSWATMQARGETDPSACTLNDLALIALDPADVPRTSPTVPGFGGPSALDTDGTTDGERVYSYQPNQVAVASAKQGVSLGMPDPRTHVVATVPAGIPGDSGAGYMDAGGRAFGSLSSLMAPTTTNGVTDLARALGYAAQYGSLGEITLVPGDRPFSPSGLPLTELPSGPALPSSLPRLVPVPLG